MKFNILYVDPPWEYKNKNTGRNMNSAARKKYSVMTFEDLKNLAISKIIQPNSILFLWVTTPMLVEGILLLQTWGFKYKTTLVWQKTQIGMGFWFRVNSEFLLIGIKGKVKAFHSQKPTVIKHKTMKHSEKPELFRDIINSCVNSSLEYKLSKLELFSRKNHKHFIDDKSDWTFIGNEIDGLDVRKAIDELAKK